MMMMMMMVVVVAAVVVIGIRFLIPQNDNDVWKAKINSSGRF
jgi:high-affinity Fe2+/Pb2+ permease